MPRTHPLTGRRALPAATLSALAALTHATFGLAHEARSLDEDVAQLEASWSHADGGKQYEYFVRASAIATSLYSQEGKGTEAAAVRLLDNLLEKDTSAEEIGTADLIAKSKVARFMLSARSDDAEVRQSQSKSLERLLDQVHKEAIAGYVPRTVSMNVIPPPGPGLRFAGMNPAAIDDVAARKRYEAAIRENQQNARINSRQDALRRLEKELASRVREQHAERP